MELTEDFPISYPVPLKECWNIVLKDLRQFTSYVFQLVAVSRHSFKFNTTHVHVCEAYK